MIKSAPLAGSGRKANKRRRPLFSPFRPSTADGYSLLEVSLTLMLLVVLAGITIPSVAGWIDEQKIRNVASDLIETVQLEKIETEKHGRTAVVRILAPTKISNSEQITGETFFIVPHGFSITLTEPGRDAGAETIRINRHGFVEPVRVLVARDNRWLEFSFDFLTGHARDESFSF